MNQNNTYCLYGKGFTLVELMVTLSVIAILVTVGIPALGEFVHDTQQKTAFSKLISAYAFARQEAVHRGKGVSICPVKRIKPTQCTNNWSEGVLIYINKAGGSKFQAGDEKLKFVLFPENITLDWKKNTYLMTINPEGGTAAGSFTLKKTDGSSPFKLIISSIGRSRIEK